MKEIYKGIKKPHDGLKEFLETYEAPPWRVKSDSDGRDYDPTDDEKMVVNLALHLRRPILLGGDPGVGKSSLAKSVAYELTKSKVLHWQITTHSVLKDGLYEYDAVARLQDVKESNDTTKSKSIGDFLTLGALGSAFASDEMRVVLVDELDKSDIDFPNNLLHILEEMEFPIPELARTGKSEHEVYDADGKKIKIKLENGKLRCKVFPLIIFTSNKEREFSPAFLRRVITHDITLPDDKKELEDRLYKILSTHLKDIEKFQEIEEDIREIIKDFISNIQEEGNQLSTDMLMNAVFLKLQDVDVENKKVLQKIWHKLSS